MQFITCSTELVASNPNMVLYQALWKDIFFMYQKCLTDDWRCIFPTDGAILLPTIPGQTLQINKINPFLHLSTTGSGKFVPWANPIS